MPSFTHLHVASAFTAHHGTATPEALVAATIDAGVDAAAITDRDGIYGAVRHIRACIAAGVAPIVGADLQVHDGESLSEVTVLAHGHTRGAGWAGLVRLISAAHSPRRRQRTLAGTANRSAWATANQVPAFLGGEDGPIATVLLGPRSDVGQAVLAGERARAEMLLQAWVERLPGGVAVEVVCHHTEPGTSASLRHASDMLQLAHSLDVPAVLTNAVRHLRPQDAITGDILDSAALLQPLGTFEPQTAQAWLKPPSLMHAIARQIVEYAGLRHDDMTDLLTTTERLADRCCLDPEADLAWRKPKVPELDAIGLTPGTDPRRVLRQHCESGLTERYPHATGTTLRHVRDRMDDELATIAHFGFESYFLTVADTVDLIRSMGIRVQARGSGASSLVNHLLRISAVGPIEHDLLAERFLGNARSMLPDIDIDVESARRHDIYRAIFARYGHHRVTLLSAQSTYRARGAVRDAGAALGLGKEQIDRIAENIWRFDPAGFRQALATKPELRDIAAQISTDAQLERLVDLTARLDRLPRHISMHSCGVILGDSNLLSLTATQPSGMGLPMSQFDKDDIDDMGLLKLDVLGVRMQSTLAHTLDEITCINGPSTTVEGGLPADAPYVSAEGRIDLEQIPQDDEPTFELLRSTHTLGCFQIESPGQRELLGKMQPDAYEDLIADISLFRPGPMQANMVAPFLDRKHGYESVTYLHSRFRPFLWETFGVVIYHEQLMRILADCMDVSLADADEIRRAMTGDLTEIEKTFRTRTAARLDEDGLRIFTDRDIDRIWETVGSFGAFGFCKAHGACFALPTFQSAWLKTHYPVEFLAGVLEHDPGMYPRRLLVAEARRIGIRLLPVDVNASTNSYRVERISPEEKGIRIGFRNIAGITDAEQDRLMTGQPYTSITDLYHRARPSRPLMMRLARLGALDTLNQDQSGRAHRGGIIAYVRQLTAKPRTTSTGPPDGQEPLFTDSELVDVTIPDPSAAEQVAADLDVLSTEVEGHVMDSYRPLLEHLGVTPAHELLGLRSGSEVIVAGIRVATQTPPMRSGNRTVFISLDDGSGVIDTTLFEDAQQQATSDLFTARTMLIRGRTRRTGEKGISVQADEAHDLHQIWSEWAQ